MTPTIACVAALLHLTAPPHPPPILTIPASVIAAIPSDDLSDQGLYGRGVIVLAPGATLAVRAHELAHAVQDYNHRSLDEAEANFAARHAAAWCQENAR